MKRSEERASKNRFFCDIFGCSAESFYKEARQGKVIFFDAFPSSLSETNIQIDIMNPHYSPYYGEGKPPADYHQPIPIHFLTVKNALFDFYIGIRASANKEEHDHDDKLLNKTKEYLREALTLQGIGAKTAVGYGHFNSEKS